MKMQEAEMYSMRAILKYILKIKFSNYMLNKSYFIGLKFREPKVSELLH